MTDVWMPLYIGDYMADTGHLGALEHGAYLMLMFHYWRHHGLPAEDAKLARIARCTAKEWSGVRDTVLAFFGPDLRHKRIDQEIEQASENAAKAKARAERAAAVRWGKQSSSNAPSIPEASPQAMLDQCPSPSPSPVKKEKAEAKASAKKFTLPDDFPLTEKRTETAKTKGIIDVRIEFDRWKDDARANRRTYADWDAAWRKWCDSHYQEQNPNSTRFRGQRSGPQGSSGLAGAARTALAAGGERGLRTDGLPFERADHAGAAGDSADPFAQFDQNVRSNPRRAGGDALPVIDQEPVEI